jgi:hypothetical protein
MHILTRFDKITGFRSIGLYVPLILRSIQELAM